MVYADDDADLRAQIAIGKKTLFRLFKSLRRDFTGAASWPMPASASAVSWSPPGSIAANDSFHCVLVDERSVPESED